MSEANRKYLKRSRCIREAAIDQHNDEFSVIEISSSDESSFMDMIADTDPDRSEYCHISSSDEDFDDDGKDNIVNDILQTSNMMIAPSGMSWNTFPSKLTKYASYNILRFTAGPKKKGEIFSPLDAFRKFITSDILSEIILQTNAEATRILSLKNRKWEPIDKDEMDAFIGILIMSGSEKSRRVPIRELFLDKCSNPIYTACMSVGRFENIKRFLRFDDKRTRNYRIESDKLAPISHIWNLFLHQCRTVMIPQTNLTIDEQLVAFRGRCGFIQYMPSKPAKYGIKIFWLCESQTGYAIDGTIYIGKQPGESVQRNLGMNTVINLIKSIRNSARNVTMDNFFTSVELFEYLLSVKLTAVGTIRKNKRDIPKDMQANKERGVLTSLFCFRNNMTLVSYIPKRNKAVQLLSTLHQHSKVNNNNKMLPEIIEFYNKNKGGVDLLDQMISSYTCNRQTKRWPNVIWSNMIDVAALNAFHLFIIENQDYECNRLDRRRLFLKDLGKQLMLPHMNKRLEISTLHKSIRDCILKFVNINSLEEQTILKDQARRRCRLCPSSKDRKCDRNCIQCQKPICKDHTIYFCQNCG